MRELEKLKRKGNEVWIWSVVVELSDGSIKKFLFAGEIWGGE